MKNNPFNDTNKLTTFIATRLFVMLNRYDLPAIPENSYKTIIRVVASEISKSELTPWIRDNLKEILGHAPHSNLDYAIIDLLTSASNSEK